MTQQETDLSGRYGQLRRDGWEEFQSIAFADLVGPLWERTIDGVVQVGFLAEPKHGNRAGFVQGGMIATLADVALGVTARNADRSRAQATIELNVQYIEPGRIGEFIVGHGRILRETKHLVFLTGVIETDGRIVASMSGVWKINRR